MYPSDYKRKDLTSITEKELGTCGRMVSDSKSGYRQANPNHFVVFNANVCTKEDGKIWYGDVDITLDEGKLKEIATVLNKEVFVLHERDCRFDDDGKQGKEIEDYAIWSSEKGDMRKAYESKHK